MYARVVTLGCGDRSDRHLYSPRHAALRPRPGGGGGLSAVRQRPQLELFRPGMTPSIDGCHSGKIVNLRRQFLLA